MSMHRSVVPITVYVDDEEHVFIRDGELDPDGNEHDAIAIPIQQVPQILEWLEEGLREAKRIGRAAEDAL